MTMIRFWKDLNFSTKLTLIFFLVLSLTIGLITTRQSYTSFALLETNSLEHMENLAGQVVLNFTQALEDIENSTYTSMTSRQVPRSLGGETTYANQKYTLATMISSSTSYDYILARNAWDQLICTDFRQDVAKSLQPQIEADCKQILEEYQDNTQGSCSWIRMESGQVYLLRDIYDTQPMRHTGVMVLHIAQPFFAVNSNSEDTGFLFLDKSGNFLTYTGTDVTEEMLSEVVSDVENGTISRKNDWSDGEYFAAWAKGSQWGVVVIRSTRSYREGCDSILRNGILLGALGLVLGMVLVYVLTKSALKKLAEIKESMKGVAEGNFDCRIEVTDQDDISQLAIAFNEMSQKISQLMDQLVEKERMRSNAELQVLEYKYRALETQIRPHFIYNALEVISSMAKIKGETEMIHIVQTISRYFRSITQNITDQFVTVQQEFDRLQDYTEIYRFMHGDKLKTVFSAREVARNAMIPTMILQPVVENALKYGLRSQEEDSEIRVHAYAREGKLFITIRDSGKGLSPEQLEKLEKGETSGSSQSSGIGMANVRQRLKLIYGDESSVTFRNREGGGVKVTIEIPFAYSEPDDLEELEQMDGWDDLDELW